MNKHVYMILLVITSLHTITTTCALQEIVEKTKNFFSGTMLEKVDHQELPAASIQAIAIDAINGSVTIKTGPQKLLVVKTIIRAKKQEDLDAIEVTFDVNDDNRLAIATHYEGKKNSWSVEYELIVPACMNIELTITGNGDALIKDVHGTIDVVTNDNITVTNSKKSVSAQTLKKGSITIVNAQGPVHTHSQQGNITGENIAHSFFANSTTGKVSVTYKKLPATSAIDLTTTAGNIMLALPVDTNAEIKGRTINGTIISDHYITLKPYATRLNKSAWSKFTKEVDGILGTGQATIMVQSTKGNVKIVETKTT